MKNTFLKTALILALAIALPCRAAQPDQALPSPAAEASLASALDLFQRARAGDKGAVEPAIAAFEELARAEPLQPRNAAYLGSALALRGRDAWMPWNKIRYVEDGTDRIDAALAALKPEHDLDFLRGVPASVETRFVAASTFVKIPDAVFHRRADGKRLISGLLRSPALSAASSDFRAAVHLAAADLAHEEGRRQDEADQLRQSLALVGFGIAADRARARLQELGL